MHKLGHTRSTNQRDHLLHTPDTFVRAVLPGMERATAIVHISPAAGAAFTQYTAELEPGGSLGPTSNQRFLYALEGVADLATDRTFQTLTAGSYAYLPEDGAHTTITNPVLVVEVLSVTTEKGDRGNKWMHYQRMPSLQEYVLVSQEPRIEIYRRTTHDTWVYFEVREGAVRLTSGPTLDLSLLYADLPV